MKLSLFSGLIFVWLFIAGFSDGSAVKRGLNRGGRQGDARIEELNRKRQSLRETAKFQGREERSEIFVNGKQQDDFIHEHDVLMLDRTKRDAHGPKLMKEHAKPINFRPIIG